jgi:hypothetical protein
MYQAVIESYSTCKDVTTNVSPRPPITYMQTSQANWDAATDYCKCFVDENTSQVNSGGKTSTFLPLPFIKNIASPQNIGVLKLDPSAENLSPDQKDELRQKGWKSCRRLFALAMYTKTPTLSLMSILKVYHDEHLPSGRTTR